MSETHLWQLITQSTQMVDFTPDIWSPVPQSAY